MALNRVSPVGAQGRCGSCYAFGAVSVAASAHAIAHGAPAVAFSEQQVLCGSRANPYGNLGCSGGWLDAALQYVLDTGLLPAAASPYTASTAACPTYSAEELAANATALISAYALAPACTGDGSEARAYFEEHLLTGTVFAGVDAGVAGFATYGGGVFDAPVGPGRAINHALQIVGMGVDAPTGLPYWLCKNSWGPGWGEGGFVRIRRDSHNTAAQGCGAIAILSFAYTVTGV